ncbi:MAG TPA: hypothetical protein EYP19_13645 [Desulfobacterales bacterium]|nr:hypothetical protein [Desulfobacterales bacterium]
MIVCNYHQQSLKKCARNDHEGGESSEQATRNQSDNDQSSNHRKLILDATVAEQTIRYPTDLNLLNEAREISKKTADILYPQTGAYCDVETGPIHTAQCPVPGGARVTMPPPSIVSSFAHLLFAISSHFITYCPAAPERSRSTDPPLGKYTAYCLRGI